MTPDPGTYALVLHRVGSGRVAVGRLGAFDLTDGYYIYVGSAFGPGGVRARVGRHFRARKTLHWHVDFLTQHASVVEAWYTHDGTRWEHCWADILARTGHQAFVKGFGSSDCSCFSHLFHSAMRPNLSSLRRALAEFSPNHGPLHRWKPR